MIYLGKYSGLHCIWFKLNDLFSALSKCIKQHDDIEFFTHENETLIEIHRWLLAYYGEDTVDISTVHQWVWKSWDNGGNLDMNDQLQSGRPVRATHNANRQRAIQENWHISQTTIAYILNTGLLMSMTLQNLCAWWVLHKFTYEMKTATQEAHHHLLTCYESDGNDFLHSNVTGDESQVHHYDPKLKIWLP